jgi:yecA family protein
VQYELLTAQANAVGLATGLTENHGMLCGLLCGGAKDAERLWLEEVFEDCDFRDPAVVALEQQLIGLAAEAREAITGPGLGFAPLLPDDEQALSLRANALRDWCGGFLYGLGLAGVKTQQLGGVAGEALQDLAAIARMEPQSGPDREEDEEAFAELAEFVWVAAMLIYEEQVQP